mmetsp:Transcript_32776/g.77705  ORF Transcript_32776/g.77705 Transcript_32776/m.77705 type:complete len:223 (+) Transcript_32776:1267-1935(+)
MGTISFTRELWISATRTPTSRPSRCTTTRTPCWPSSGTTPSRGGVRRRSCWSCGGGGPPPPPPPPPMKKRSEMHEGRAPVLSPRGSSTPALAAKVRSEPFPVGSLTIPLRTCLAKPTAPPMGATPICVSDLSPRSGARPDSTPSSARTWWCVHVYVTLLRRRCPICPCISLECILDWSEISCHPPSSRTRCRPSSLWREICAPRIVSVNEQKRWLFVVAWKI